MTEIRKERKEDLNAIRYVNERAFETYGLENEYGADEHFMALELRNGALAEIGGLVTYQPEFKETGC